MHRALEIDSKDEELSVFLPWVNKAASASFLRELVALEPEAVHVVIQDQAGFHLKGQDERLPDNVRLLPLPPYSPELNPEERVGDLMKDATGNRVFASLEEMGKGIEADISPL